MSRRSVAIISAIPISLSLGLAVTSYALVRIGGSGSVYTIPLAGAAHVADLPVGDSGAIVPIYAPGVGFLDGGLIVFYQTPWGLTRTTKCKPFFLIVHTGGPYAVVSIAFGPIIFLCAVPPVVLIIRSGWRGRKSRPANRCRQCGYDLTGNTSGVCPECGTPIDRATSPDPPSSP